MTRLSFTKLRCVHLLVMPVKERYGEGKDEETAETALTDAGTQQGNGSLQSEMLFLSADLLALSPFFFLLGGGVGGALSLGCKPTPIPLKGYCQTRVQSLFSPLCFDRLIMGSADSRRILNVPALRTTRLVSIMIMLAEALDS